MDVWVCYRKRSGIFSSVERIVDSEEKALAWIKEVEAKMAGSTSSIYWNPIATKITVQ